MILNNSFKLNHVTIRIQIDSTWLWYVRSREDRLNLKNMKCSRFNAPLLFQHSFPNDEGWWLPRLVKCVQLLVEIMFNIETNNPNMLVQHSKDLFGYCCETYDTSSIIQNQTYVFKSVTKTTTTSIYTQELTSSIATL